MQDNGLLDAYSLIFPASITTQRFGGYETLNHKSNPPRLKTPTDRYRRVFLLILEAFTAISATNKCSNPFSSVRYPKTVMITLQSDFHIL